MVRNFLTGGGGIEVISGHYEGAAEATEESLNTRCFASLSMTRSAGVLAGAATAEGGGSTISFFLVPELLLGNANFTPSSAWGHFCITHNLLILRDIFCQAGAWQQSFMDLRPTHKL